MDEAQKHWWFGCVLAGMLEAAIGVRIEVRLNRPARQHKSTGTSVSPDHNRQVNV